MCVVCVLASCQDPSAQSINLEATPSPSPSVTPEPEQTKPAIPDELLSSTPEQLCSRIAEIKTIPTRNPTPTDPIYEALLLQGKAAIPCLIEKIVYKKGIRDPRYSVPVWQNFAVGDSAVFTLIAILRKEDIEQEKLLISMLPRKFQEEWKTNGIYAYFNYVSEPKNRKQLQAWWKNWINLN